MHGNVTNQEIPNTDCEISHKYMTPQLFLKISLFNACSGHGTLDMIKRLGKMTLGRQFINTCESNLTTLRKQQYIFRNYETKKNHWKQNKSTRTVQINSNKIQMGKEKKIFGKSDKNEQQRIETLDTLT